MEINQRLPEIGDIVTIENDLNTWKVRQLNYVNNTMTVEEYPFIPCRNGILSKYKTVNFKHDKINFIPNYIDINL